jgi:hypothetical protein
VNGTPTFFINGARFDGDWTDMDAFTRALEEASHAASGHQGTAHPPLAGTAVTHPPGAPTSLAPRRASA